MALRFVILHHRTGSGEHWDLMLEHGDALATWQLDADPTQPGALPIPAHRIGDHRKAYFDYEGRIARGRGEVTRVDRGSLEIEEITASRWSFRVKGRHLTGRFLLALVEGVWMLRCYADGGGSSARPV